MHEHIMIRNFLLLFHSVFIYLRQMYDQKLFSKSEIRCCNLPTFKPGDFTYICSFLYVDLSLRRAHTLNVTMAFDPS